MRSGHSFFQRVAASLIIPITLLPLAAVLLAIGSQLGIGPVEAAGLAIIRSWLPLFYGIGISIGFTDSDAMGALSVAAGFVVMVATAEAVSGDPTINLGVLGGIVAGAVATWIFNRVKRLELPEYLALFSGKRMGPIAAAVAGLGLGYLFGLFWPPIQTGIVSIGEWMYGAGGLGVFVYGAALRLLIPTGLHHILMQFVDVQLGGWVDPATGRLVAGEYLRFLAGDPSAGRILSGFFLTLGFGPLGAAMAITREARPEQRRKVAGLMTTGALTAMVLGVTEPVEFAFIFASPALFGLHVVLSGLASFLGWALGIHLGGYALPMAFINSALPAARNGLLLIPLGLLWTALYYYMFRAVIRWLRPPILGQVPEEVTELQSANGPADGEAEQFLEALGGQGNLVALDACMTRLRVCVRDPGGVDVKALQRLGAATVLGSGTDWQVVVGARAGEVAGRMRAVAGQALLPVVAESTVPAVTSAGAAALDRGRALPEVSLVAPLAGRVIPLTAVPDPVFASGVVGEGLAIEPSDGHLFAPVSGTVMHIFPGGHAIGFVTPEGLEILLHVGLETVALRGEGFALSIAEGDQVRAGDPIGECDLERIAARGKSLVTPLLVTNRERIESFRPLSEGRVEVGALLMGIRLRPPGGE